MTCPLRATRPSGPRKSSLFALAFALALPLFPLPVVAAAAHVSPNNKTLPLADKAPALPLTSKFAKVTEAEGGPYVLTLTNTSDHALKVTAKILLSVSFHAESKARNLPEHTIDAGKVWTISELAANDKVILHAKDYAPLELLVP